MEQYTFQDSEGKDYDEKSLKRPSAFFVIFVWWWFELLSVLICKIGQEALTLTLHNEAIGSW